jgi:hypothetical protein
MRPRGIWPIYWSGLYPDKDKDKMDLCSESFYQDALKFYLEKENQRKRLIEEIKYLSIRIEGNADLNEVLMAWEMAKRFMNIREIFAEIKAKKESKTNLVTEFKNEVNKILEVREAYFNERGRKANERKRMEQEKIKADLDKTRNDLNRERYLIDMARQKNGSNGGLISKPTNNICKTENQETILTEIKLSENKFWKGIPMDKVVNHFEVMTSRKNKKGSTFLTTEQFISFLKKGFLNDLTQQKQIINCSGGEKGFVIKRFYEFYDLTVSQYKYPSKTDKFIKLFTDCFSNWDENTIKSFFKRDKTKENW